MESSKRNVYCYRSWWGFFKAWFWILAGPPWAYITVQLLLHPTAHPYSPYIGWIWWLWPLALSCQVFESLLVILSFINERIILDGSKIEYYNMLRWRKISLDVSDIEEIERTAGPAWCIFTRQGRFKFSDDLRGYQDLLGRLEAAGKHVSRIPHL